MKPTAVIFTVIIASVLLLGCIGGGNGDTGDGNGDTGNGGTGNGGDQPQTFKKEGVIGDTLELGYEGKLSLTTTLHSVEIIRTETGSPSFEEIEDVTRVYVTVEIHYDHYALFPEFSSSLTDSSDVEYLPYVNYMGAGSSGQIYKDDMFNYEGWGGISLGDAAHTPCTQNCEHSGAIYFEKLDLSKGDFTFQWNGLTFIFSADEVTVNLQ